MSDTGSTQECRARIEQEMVDEVGGIKLETSGNLKEIVPDFVVSLRKRNVSEPDINAAGQQGSTADTPKEVRI